jgi:hypothetical protein
MIAVHDVSVGIVAIARAMQRRFGMPAAFANASAVSFLRLRNVLKDERQVVLRHPTAQNPK